MNSIKMYFLIVAGFFSVKCSELVEVEDPRNELSKNVVFSDDVTANSAIVGIYADMTLTDHYLGNWVDGLQSIASLTSDEFSYVYGVGLGLVQNDISTDDTSLALLWKSAYKSIYQVNVFLEGLIEADALSEGLKMQLEGEAKFIRAFNYFYLVNLFGDVPLVLESDYRATSIASRVSSLEIYNHIVNDLQEAMDLMADDYSFSNGEKVRVNRFCAEALLSRVYLYLGEWKDAVLHSSSIIDGDYFFLTDSLSDVFLANSSEAIWQIIPARPLGSNPPEAYMSYHNSIFTFSSLTSQVLDAFEMDDDRKRVWVGVNTGNQFIYKYKANSSTAPFTEYSTPLRLAEQILIRSEASAMMGDIENGLVDLNMVRARAGLDDLVLDEKVELLEAIERERRIELLSEFGHRWLDLKRWGKATLALDSIKVGWQKTDVLFPIPELEIQKNPMLYQNEGYLGI